LKYLCHFTNTNCAKATASLRREIHLEPAAVGQAAHALPGVQKTGAQIISGFSSPHKLKPVSITDAKKAGFQVYKKLGKGEYERQ